MYGLGFGILAYFLRYFVAGRATASSAPFDVLPPILLTAGLALFCRWHTQSSVESRYVWHAAGWIGLGTLFLGSAGAVSLYYLELLGGEAVRSTSVTVGWATGGFLIGQVVGIHAVERRRERDRVRQLNQRLAVLQRVLRHDIRNGANVITGNADLLLEDRSQATAHVEAIKERVARLVHLSETARDIEGFLSDARTTSEPVDVADLLGEAVDALRVEHPGVTFDVELPETQRAFAVPQIGLALRNVLENTVEHNDRASLTVSVIVTTGQRDGDEYVAIRIADDGSGLPAVERRVLESDTETPLSHSTGLGLWLIRWVVDESDGELLVGENDPHGTVVDVRLPAARANQPLTAPTPPHGPQRDDSQP